MDSEFYNKRRSYIDSLKKNIRSRLRKEDGDAFSDLSKVLEPDTVKDTPRDKCLKSLSSLDQFYGYAKETVVIDKDINNKVERRTEIPALLDQNKLQTEWPRLEGMIKGAYSGYSTKKLCKKIILHHRALLPNLSLLVSIAVVMCVSSVECERSFSVQNRLKVKYRSSLKPEKLDILLKIKMLGPDIQHFDPVPAVTRWRRVKEDYKPRKKAKTC
ncbi:hypothetical protein DPMN_181874 [Dreissena polymorpha]|uniref:HAT C-terminal dimerisation domain-containing protein n=1 Tax=Dreissena polymorpha TaxID=45954 RepID=A0A9D4I5P2_DREPO|nr:hypothetical protein DPMN_181874 [Dreissena polymorpha]